MEEAARASWGGWAAHDALDGGQQFRESHRADSRIVRNVRPASDGSARCYCNRWPLHPGSRIVHQKRRSDDEHRVGARHAHAHLVVVGDAIRGHRGTEGRSACQPPFQLISSTGSNRVKRTTMGTAAHRDDGADVLGLPVTEARCADEQRCYLSRRHAVQTSSAVSTHKGRKLLERSSTWDPQ